MNWRKDSHGIFVKLDRGEELFPSLEELAEKELHDGGMIVMAIGMLKNSVVGYYNGTTYEKRTLEKGHELLGLHGSIRILDGSGEENRKDVGRYGGGGQANLKTEEGGDKKERRIGLHIHCMMANERHEVVGGHLFSATVDPLVEMFIVPAEEAHLTVKYNEKTGLDEMKIESRMSE